MLLTLDLNFSFKTTMILTNTIIHFVHGNDYIVSKFRSFRQTSSSKNPSEKWSTSFCQKRVPTLRTSPWLLHIITQKQRERKLFSQVNTNL